MILVSGFNVYPTDVEQVLYRHPKVLKVCVVGVPDDTTGEAVKAYIVLKEGQSATVEEIVTFAKDPKHGLTGYRVPKLVEFRESLPETLVGKVLRRVLLEEEKQKQGAGAATAPKNPQAASKPKTKSPAKPKDEPAGRGTAKSTAKEKSKGTTSGSSRGRSSKGTSRRSGR